MEIRPPHQGWLVLLGLATLLVWGLFATAALQHFHAEEVQLRTTRLQFQALLDSGRCAFIAPDTAKRPPITPRP